MPASLQGADPARRVEAETYADTVRDQLRTMQRAQAELGQTLMQIADAGLMPLFGYARLQPFLQEIGYLGKKSANKLVKRAKALNPHREGSSVIPAKAPLTGAAAAEGLLSDDNIDMILEALGAIPEEHHATAEPKLVAMAKNGGPDQVRTVGERILGHVRPDGDPPAEPGEPERRCFLHKKRKGGWKLEADVDDVAGAFMNATLDAMSQPRTGDDGPDLRDITRRRADALVDVFDMAMNSPDLPTQAGERIHLTVTIPAAVLKSAMGQACLDLTTQISAWEARVWACDCTVLPATLGADGEVLDLGRAKRLITPGQRRALYLRDRGCAFPGCNRPPRNCQGHHIIHWDHGGPTNLANLVLLCAHHHRVLHRTGWDVRLAPDGLPEFLPPSWLDRERKPRRNNLHPPIAL